MLTRVAALVAEAASSSPFTAPVAVAVKPWLAAPKDLLAFAAVTVSDAGLTVKEVPTQADGELSVNHNHRSSRSLPPSGYRARRIAHDGSHRSTGNPCVPIGFSRPHDSWVIEITLSYKVKLLAECSAQALSLGGELFHEVDRRQVEERMDSIESGGRRSDSPSTT